MKQRGAFEEKHKEALEEMNEKITKTELACSFCHESASAESFATNPYGYPVLYSSFGANEMAIKQTYEKLQVEGEKHPYLIFPASIFKNTNFNLLSCGHIMHISCYKKFSESQKKVKSCPICKSPFTVVLPALDSPSPDLAPFCIK